MFIIYVYRLIKFCKTPKIINNHGNWCFCFLPQTGKIYVIRVTSQVRYSSVHRIITCFWKRKSKIGELGIRFVYFFTWIFELQNGKFLSNPLTLTIRHYLYEVRRSCIHLGFSLPPQSCNNDGDLSVTRKIFT